MTEPTLLQQSWPEPIFVTGAAAAVEGDVAVPDEIRDDVAVAPFPGVDRFLASRVPSAAALVTALGNLQAQPGIGTLPPPPARGMVIGTWAAAVAEVRSFMTEVERVGGNLVNPGLFPFTVINAAAGRAAIEHACEGPNLTLNNGPTSALDAVAYAADLAAQGTSQLLFAGGFEGIADGFGPTFGRTGAPAVTAAVLAIAAASSAAAARARPLARIVAFAAARQAGADSSDLQRLALAAALARAQPLVPGATVSPPLGGPLPEAPLLALIQATRQAAAGGPPRLVPVLAGAAGTSSAAVLVLSSAGQDKDL